MTRPVVSTFARFIWPASTECRAKPEQKFDEVFKRFRHDWTFLKTKETSRGSRAKFGLNSKFIQLLIDKLSTFFNAFVKVRRTVQTDPCNWFVPQIFEEKWGTSQHQAQRQSLCSNLGRGSTFQSTPEENSFGNLRKFYFESAYLGINDNTFALSRFIQYLLVRKLVEQKVVKLYQLCSRIYLLASPGPKGKNINICTSFQYKISLARISKTVSRTWPAFANLKLTFKSLFIYI